MSTLLYTSLLGLCCMLAEVLNLRKLLVPLVIIGLSFIFWVNFQEWNTPSDLTIGPVSLANMVMFDHFSIAFSGLAIIIAILLFILSANYYSNEEKNLSDYLSILIFALVGALVMFSFANLAMLFLGIEILSISIYIMAGSRRFDKRSNESGFKYFLMGAFASGFLLFGIALVYGAAGSFEFSKITQYLNSSDIHPMFHTGVLLILFALLFKVSAVPFHFWSPDVYEGAPVLITAFMSTLVKVAAFGAIYRLFNTAFVGIIPFTEPILYAVIIATLFVSNAIALQQQNVKRMLAYSGISHAGYMLIAILSMINKTDDALYFYSVSYAIATIGLFALVISTFKSNMSEQFEAFNGLSKKNPFAAAAITIFLLSMAGIPPLAGFFGKYNLFSEAVSAGYINLVIIAVINSAISIYYYFKMILAMYTKPADEKPLVITCSYWTVAVICLLLTIIIGVVPDSLMQLLR